MLVYILKSFLDSAHLVAIVQVTPDEVTRGGSAPSGLVDLDAGINFPFLADGVGVGVDPCAVASFEGGGDRGDVVESA